MSPVTERGIHGHLARDRSQHLQHFSHTNGAMRACGSLARCQHLLERLRVFFRIELLIFILEATRILPRIARAAFRLFGRSFHLALRSKTVSCSGALFLWAGRNLWDDGTKE